MPSDGYHRARLPGSSKTPIWLLFFGLHLFLYAGVVVAHMLLPVEMLKYYILAGALGFILLLSTVLLQVVVGSRVASLGAMLQQDPQVIVGDRQCVSKLSRVPWYGVSEIDTLQLAILQTYNAYAIDSKAAGKQLAKVSSERQKQQQRRKARKETTHSGAVGAGPHTDSSSNNNASVSPLQQQMLTRLEGGSGGARDDDSFRTADSFEYEPVRDGFSDDEDDGAAKLSANGKQAAPASSQSRMRRVGYALGRKLRVVKADSPPPPSGVVTAGQHPIGTKDTEEHDDPNGTHPRDYYALAVNAGDNETRSLLTNRNKKSSAARIKRLFGRGKNTTNNDGSGDSAESSDVLYSCSSGGDAGAISSSVGGRHHHRTVIKNLPPSPPLASNTTGSPNTHNYGSLASSTEPESRAHTEGGDDAAAAPHEPLPPSTGIMLSPTFDPAHVKEYDPLFDNSSSWDVVQKGITDPGKSLLLQLLGQVKVGQGLSTVTLPVTILECRSLLERLSDMCVHWSYLLPVANSTVSDDYQRMVAVFRWFIAAYRMKPAGARKPYNPILGEVFHCIVHNGDDPRYPKLRQLQRHRRHHHNHKQSVTSKQALAAISPAEQAELESIDAIEFIAEQVSHHPPASAIYARHKDLIELKGIYHPHSKLVSLNCAASLAEGGFDVVFPKVERGIPAAASQVTKPGKKSRDGGETTGAPVSGAAKAAAGRRYHITWPSFFASGIVSGNPRMEIGGTVTITDVDTGIHAKVEFLRKGWLSGEYDQMECVILTPEGKNALGKKFHGTWFDVIHVSDVNAKGVAVGPKRVFHNPSDAAPCAARPQAVPTPGHPKQSRGIWRELTRSLREDHTEGAAEAKNLVESTQRQERKELAAAGREAVPAFFKFVSHKQHHPSDDTSNASFLSADANDGDAAVRAFKQAPDTEKYKVDRWDFVGESSLLL